MGWTKEVIGSDALVLYKFGKLRIINLNYVTCIGSGAIYTFGGDNVPASRWTVAGSYIAPSTGYVYICQIQLIEKSHSSAPGLLQAIYFNPGGTTAQGRVCGVLSYYVE